MSPGSVEEIGERLRTWCRNAPRGLARVEFDSEFARRRVIDGLRQALAQVGTPFHEIVLPDNAPASVLVRAWIEEMTALGPGVVSISGFARALPPSAPLEDSLQALSFNRENLARLPLRQIWWMPPSFVEMFVRVAPDLDSWFLLRLHLKEGVSPPARGQEGRLDLSEEFPEKEEVESFRGRSGKLVAPWEREIPEKVEDARRRSQELAARLEKAIESGAPAEELFQLAFSAVGVLQKVGAEKEARELAVELAQEIGKVKERAEEKSNSGFFISYTRADRRWAEWIAWVLEEEGYNTIIQAWDFRPGADFVLEIQRATAQAERTIAVLSPDYLNARFTQPEWAAAFAQDPTGEKKVLVPVRVHECDLRGLLPQLIYIDLVGLDEEAARKVLLKGIKEGRAKPEESPTFPGAARSTTSEHPPFPGALPSVWNVPHRCNPNFTGREELLENLRTALGSSQAVASVQVITGLGGIGKTQIAVEYSYRNMADYQAVWWVRAGESVTLSSDYAALAGQLGLPGKDLPDQSAVVQAVRRWLGQHRGWLLIFDNAVDLMTLHDYLPQGGGGQVLITSRNPNWRGVVSPLSVRVLERDQSVEFLCKRTGKIDREGAKALAEAVGDLPLALEQAGAYTEAKGISLSEYLRLFCEYRQELLRRDRPPADYPDTVATTWELSFVQLEKEFPAGARVLSLCAFLAPNEIPRQFLQEGIGAAALEFEDSLARLRRYSLAEVGEGSLSVHRLVQAVVQDRLAEEEKRQWAGIAVKLLNEAFPYESNDVRTWGICARLMPHALAAAGYTEKLRVALDSTTRLLNQAGGYLLGRAEFVQARVLFERALASDEARYGPHHPAVAVRINNIGDVLLKLGDWAGARALFERALAIDEATYGPNHPAVARDVNNLGIVLQDLGDWAGARALFEQALAIDETAYGPDHPEVARDLNNLASVLKRQDLPGARAAYERALTIAQESYGPRHPETATYINNLGDLLQDMGDFAGARAKYERALAIDEEAYGRAHPAVARDLNNLSSVLRAQGVDLGKARDTIKQALAINERVYGPHHYAVAMNLNNLGNVLRDMGDLVKARDAYKRALSILEDILGKEHPITTAVRRTLDAIS